MKHCAFCGIARGDLPATKIYDDELVVAFLDIAPLSKGHALVIPREHHESITSVPEPIATRMTRVAAQLGACLTKAVDADAFNLLLANGACAGQVVPHTHMHVIPRSAEDNIVLPARTVAYEGDEEKERIVSEARRRLLRRVP